MVNAYDPGTGESPEPCDAALLDRRLALLGAGYRLFYSRPLRLVRGEGVWLFDSAGRRYLDAYNNVACVGHCHPEVTAAIAAQAAVLNTHTRYLHESILDYAEALLSHFPGELCNLMMTCTGSEANDLALRVAGACTGGAGLIVTRNAYHGVTLAVSGASPSLGPGNPLGKNVWTVPSPVHPDGVVAGIAEFLGGIALALDEMDACGVKPAALLVDTVFSSDGVCAEQPGFLSDAAALVRGRGGLFIADEVQAGFGRLGEGMWGFARHGVVPDLVTLGKPMGNGYPVAGVVGRRDLFEAFGAQTRYFNTFGGTPVACAAASTVLRILARDRLMENAAQVGDMLIRGFRERAGSSRTVSAVRGSGLFIGIDIVDGAGRSSPQRAADLVNAMRAGGVLVSATGPEGHVLKIRPPLPFLPEHARFLLDAFDSALAATTPRS
jgi:4-aminobutyrate aminotransferase-like enzyme